MAEIRRGFGEEGPGSSRLPWLEPVEDEDDYPEPRGGGWLKWAMLGIFIVGASVTIAMVFRGWRAQQGDVGALIKADPSPYKVRPSDPGGLRVDSNDRISQRTGVGSDIDSPLDLAALPEQPIVGAGAPPVAPSSQPAPAGPKTVVTPAPVAAKAAPSPTVTPAPVPATPAPAAATPVSGGGTVQLGAFSTEAKAKAAWKQLSKRFAYLAPLNPVILPVKSGDATLYRLRAMGGPGASICARMKVAGEACSVAN